MRGDNFEPGLAVTLGFGLADARDVQQVIRIFRALGRQCRNVQDKVREAGAEIISVEGEDTGEWVLVDIGDMVVHVMQPSVRAYYNLEELWQATPAQRRKQQAEQVAGE